MSNLAGLSAYSQYLGGNEDGHALESLTQLSCPSPVYPTMYLGGIEDGHALDSLVQLSCPSPVYPAIYLGGIEDGHALDSLRQLSCPSPVYPAMYLGGIEDGHATDSLTQLSCPSPVDPAMYFGGIEDGHATDSLTQLSCPSPVDPAMYLGGIEDGHGFIKVFEDCAPITDFSGTPLSICEGDSVTFTDLSAPVPDSWSWVFAGGTPASSTSQNPVITYNTAGTYNATLYATNSSGTGVMIKSAYITVGAVGVATITAGGATTFCSGDSVTLTSNAGSSYLWSPGGETTQSIKVKTGGTYQVTTNACDTAVAPTTITVNPNPDAIITSNAWVGTTVQLNANSAVSYLWSPGGETTQSIVVSATGTNRVEITAANGCTDTANAEVIIGSACFSAIPHPKFAVCQFTATPIDNSSVLIELSKRLDTNASYFAVERSGDNVKFELVGTQNPKLDTLQYYFWLDTEPFFDTSYYRLLQVDKNGESHYSEIAEVFLFNQRTELTALYPNPATDFLEYTITSEQDNLIFELEIFDLLGKSFLDEQGSLKQGENSSRIDVSALNKGLYFLVVTVTSTENKGKPLTLYDKFVKD